MTATARGYALGGTLAYPEPMSVLLWWLPAVVIVAIIWWRQRPARRTVRDKDLRALQRVLRGDR